MPRATWMQCSFNGGEWSPLVYGRIDIDKYKTALSICQNYIPTVQGGLTRRPGTIYVAAAKDSVNNVKLHRFEFSTTQAYVLEFGPSYIRFFTNDGQLLSGGLPYEVATTYASADIPNLKFTQSADTLYITHPSYAPAKLQRIGATNWTLTTVSFLDGPYLSLNSTATTLTLSATTGSVTVTASATTGINGGAGFRASDVGRCIRFLGGSTWGWLTVTAFTDTTHVTATVQSSPGAATATTSWRLGAWNSTDGYPGCCTFNQDRLLLAATTSYPNTVYASSTGDYENFAPSNAAGTVADSNAFTFALNSNTVNVIQWMVSDEWGLLCGTAGGEWCVSASTLQTAMTPTNISAKQTTSYGCAAVTPLRVGKSTLFVQRTLRKLREMTYQYVINTFQAPDISLLSEHLTKTGIKQLAYQGAPQTLLWLCRTDGALVGITYDKDQQCLGWHGHALGGYSDAGQTAAPLVDSVACIPDPTTTKDEVWLLVRRYINGAATRTIERMSKLWEDGDSLANAFYVDCGATYSGVATSTVSGLTWLKGQTVSVLADGSVHPPVTVSNAGTITLSRAASTIQIGLGYSSTAQTMEIEAGGADGPAQGKYKRIHRAIFRFFQSVGMTVMGSASDAAYPEPWRTSADKMDNPVALFTGDKRWAWEGKWDTEGHLYWRETDPLPSNVLAVVAQLETQDGG